MEESTSHPFEALTPDTVLDALDSVGIVSDGRMLALNSYENRVYQIGVDAAPPVVAKFYRPHRWTDEQIAEEHAFSRELADDEIPVVPPMECGGTTLHRFAGFRFALFRRQGGRAPEAEQPDTLKRIGHFIGRIHAVGARRAFESRPAIDIASFGEEPLTYLLSAGIIPPDLEAAYRSVAEQALAAVRLCYQRAGNVDSIRLHGDCHAGNLLWTDSGPHFVDFDDSRMGPAVQDLWMLLSGSGPEMTSQLSTLLEGYQAFMQFDPRQVHLIEALRTLRLIHYAAWLARRWDDPAFPAAFPWFNSQRYWQDRVLELREQIAQMNEPPLLRLC